MDRIRQIYQSLSRTETRYVKRYLTAFHSKGVNKSLELLKILEKQPDITQDEMSAELYGDPKSKAFIMLKGRLLEKLLETLSLSINFHNNPAFKEDPVAFETVNLHKQMSYALLLRRRGLDTLALEYFNKVLKRAGEAGLPEFRLGALVNLRNQASTRQELIHTYNREINEALEAFRTDIQGSGYMEEFRTMTMHQAAFNDETQAFLAESLPLLEERLADHYSLRAHYYLLTLQAYYFEALEDHTKARETLEELVELVETQPRLGSKNRMGTPYIRLAAVEMLGFRFEPAALAVERALKIIPPQKGNYLSASIYGIMAYLYLGKLAEARQMLSGVDWFRAQKRRGSRLDVISYLDACHSYLSGNLRAAYYKIGDVSELFGDKGGWNIGLRIFEIIVLADRENYDQAGGRVQALRKHIEKYNADPRVEVIYKCLAILERHIFDYQACKESLSPYLEALEHEHPWFAVSSELIRFDFWLQAKLARQSFYPMLQAVGRTD